MKRWDALADRFLEGYSARGLADGSVAAMRREWQRWGGWLKSRRPRPRLDEVAGEHVTEYLGSYGKFRAKTTQYGMMSRMRRIAQRLVGEAVHAAAVRAGITRRVTPKTLRHSFATHLMDRGVDLAVISKLMGHSSPTESGVYLHVLPGRQQEAVDCLEEEEQPTNEQEDENREDEP